MLPCPAKSNRGAILVIVAFGAALFIGILALVTDIGWAYYHQLKLQTAVNACWKAGFDSLLALRAATGESNKPSDNRIIEAQIRSIMNLNYPGATPPDVSVTIANTSPDATPGGVTLAVSGTKNVPMFFARMFGIPSFRVQAIRSAGFDAQSAAGIIPIAIPHGVVNEPQQGTYIYEQFGASDSFSTGTEYLLAPGTRFSGENATPSPIASPQSRRIHSLGGIDPDNQPEGDATEFRNRLLHGFYQPLQVGDRIILHPADASETSSCIASRIASGSAKVILPITDISPEVASGPVNSGAMTIYDLQGTENPGGKFAPSEFPFVASVRIIGFAEFELLLSESPQVRGKFVKYLIRPGNNE